MKKIVLAVMAVILLTGVVNAGELSQRNQILWENFKRIEIEKNSCSQKPIKTWDLMMRLMEIRDRLIAGKYVKKGEMIEADDSAIIATIGGGAVLKITDYKVVDEKRGTYEVVIYYDGNILERYGFSHEYLLYTVDGFEYRYHSGLTLKTIAEGMSNKIHKILKWETEDPLLPQTIEKALKKIQ